MKSAMRNRYLLWFANEHVDFRWPEISSLLSMYKIQMNIKPERRNSPFWIVDLQTEEDARILASRAMSLRSVIKLWGSGSSLEELHQNIKEYPDDLKTPVFRKDKSFRVNVTTFNRTFTMKEKVEKIELFDYLPVEGPVDLKSPDHVLHYIEDYGMDPNKAPSSPEYHYFGLWVCDGQRNLINELSLKTRKFIGNTSMDPQLSVIMANMAAVMPGSIVFDPFVGSGSLLVAAAQAGGLVMGTDIDFLMLHGKTRPTRRQNKDIPRENESILENLKQYGLASRYIDAVVADSSLPLWRDGWKFDAIITDPPYGVREATERIGSTRHYTVEPEHVATHVPSKIGYSLISLFQDLLKMAAQRLVIGGRLVTWLPVRVGAPPDLPTHPSLQLIAVSEQPLTANTARRLLTYEKHMDLPDSEAKIPDLFPSEFRTFNFDREETRKEIAARERATRQERIDLRIPQKKRQVM